MSSPRLLIGRASRPGAFYTITTVTHARKALFLRPALAAAVAEELDRSEAETFTWVVMPDHVHWLLQLRTAPLSECVQVFKSRAARAVNALQGTRGPVWQRGFYDHRLRDGEDLQAQARYIVANPLRRGLVRRIEDYPHWHCRWITRTADLLP